MAYEERIADIQDYQACHGRLISVVLLPQYSLNTACMGP
jgi:hypothetical protein